MSVIDEIAAERRRQIEVEGWTPEHDDEHLEGELAIAGGCYAIYGGGRRDLTLRTKSNSTGFKGEVYVARGWPWDAAWWKPKDPRRDLIRAAALIVAEIERMDRKAS